MTTHTIELTRAELRDVCAGLELLLNQDFEHYGRLAATGLPDEDDMPLPRVKQLIDTRRALRNKLTDTEFEWWHQELEEQHLRADAEEAERWAGREPEVD